MLPAVQLSDDDAAKYASLASDMSMARTDDTPANRVTCRGACLTILDRSSRFTGAKVAGNKRRMKPRSVRGFGDVAEGREHDGGSEGNGARLTLARHPDRVRARQGVRYHR